MKRLLMPALLAAGLSGCAIVSPYEPYEAYQPYQSYGGYPSPPVYGPAYPAYGVTPGQAYPPPRVHVVPRVRFGLTLKFWHGRGGGHGHHHGFGGRGSWRH